MLAHICGGAFKTAEGKIGVAAIELDEHHRPYKLWMADVLVCGCGCEILRTAEYCYSQRGKEDFDVQVGQALRNSNHYEFV